MYDRLMPRSGAVLAGAGITAVAALAAEAADAVAELPLGDCCEQAVQAQATAAARINVVRCMREVRCGKIPMMHQTGRTFRCRKCRAALVGLRPPPDPVPCRVRAQVRRLHGSGRG